MNFKTIIPEAKSLGARSLATPADLIRKLPQDLQQFLWFHNLLPPTERLPIWLSRLLFNQLDTLFGGPATSGISQKQVLIKRSQPTKSLRKSGDLTAIHYVSDQPKTRCMLFLHGGGWVLGSPWSHRRFCQWVAKRCQCHVLSLDYRRSPEHPFPAALMDAEEAWQWLTNHPLLGLKTGHTLGLAGDSAGGQLAALVSARTMTKPHFQMLIYPVTDTGTDSLSMDRYQTKYLLTKSLYIWFVSQCDAQNRWPREQLSPQSHPIRGRLPPTLLALAEHDVLFDQGFVYGQTIASLGTPLELRVYPNLIHGFINLLGLTSAQTATSALLEDLETMFRTFQAKQGSSKVLP
jgi:acetyl esterase